MSRKKAYVFGRKWLAFYPRHDVSQGPCVNSAIRRKLLRLIHITICYYLPYPCTCPGSVVIHCEFFRTDANNSCASVDLRDPTTVPLNFTKSINLALSERGITSMRHSGRDDLIDNVLRGAIPMHGRMIHGRDRGGLWEAAQAYDVHGRVCTDHLLGSCYCYLHCRS